MGTATISTEFGFHLEFVDDKECVLRSRRLKSADFGHAIRHTRFDAFRRGLVDDYQPLDGGAHVEPLFRDDRSASPRARGFHVTVRLAQGREHGCEFDIGYFASSANRLRAELLRDTTITKDQEVYYRLTACLDDEAPVCPSNRLALSLEATPNCQLTSPGCRRDLGIVEAWDEPDGSELPVLVDRAVLEDVVDEARSEPDCEVGGFLLGNVKRDQETNEIYVAVTGFASGRGSTDADGTSVTFTPASFANARNFIKLRGAGETVIGWFHSHPFKLCAECPLPTPPECIAKVLFYSQDDIHLMETTFDQPYALGLLAAVDPRIEEAVGHLPVRLYGWCKGEIKSRGFEVFTSADA